MRIKFLKDEKSGFGEFTVGDVADVHEPEAQRLITAGVAEDAARPEPGLNDSGIGTPEVDGAREPQPPPPDHDNIRGGNLWS